MFIENDLRDLFRARTSHGDVRVFLRTIGSFLAYDEEKQRAFRIKIGQKGQCDLYAICRGGLHIEIECKSETAVFTTEQKMWRDFCHAFGIPWILLRDPGTEATMEAVVEIWFSEFMDLVNRAHQRG